MTTRLVRNEPFTIATQFPRAINGGALRWLDYPGVYRLRAVHPLRPAARYAISQCVGNKGTRWMFWFFPGGVHEFDRDGYRIAGSAPDGGGVMRLTLLAALADAEHHARTGEIRP